jgi:hypothetical protein
MAQQQLEQESFWRLRGPRLLAGFVGLVFLVAALVKCVDMELFVRQIKAYGIVSQRPLLIVIAWGTVMLEITLAVGLIVAYRIKLVFSATLLLLTLFLGVTVWAWYSGATEACGCFGAWLERTPGEAALEDVVLLAITAFAWNGFGRLKISQARWKTRAVLSACIIGLALPAIFGFPFSGIQQASSQEGETQLGDFKAQGLGDMALNSGTYLVVVMDTGCDHCQEIIPQLNMLAETPGLPQLVGLCVNNESDRMAFLEEFQPTFPLGQIEDNVFWRLLGDGDMPRTILTHDGYVKQIWDLNPPTADAVPVKLSDIKWLEVLPDGSASQPG